MNRSVSFIAALERLLFFGSWLGEVKLGKKKINNNNNTGNNLNASKYYNKEEIEHSG